jgi:hypothetical protein
VAEYFILPSMTRRLVFFAALDCAVTIIGNNCSETRFTFTTISANDVAIGIAFCMPLVMAIAGVPIARRWLRYALTALLLPVAAIGLPLAALSFVMATMTTRFDAPTILPAGRYTLALFTSDYGAMDSGAVIVDQVCRVVPGLVLSRVVSESRGLESPEIVVLDRDHIRINGRPVALRPIIWPLC